jgi:hypothetical protein
MSECWLNSSRVSRRADPEARPQATEGYLVAVRASEMREDAGGTLRGERRRGEKPSADTRKGCELPAPPIDEKANRRRKESAAKNNRSASKSRLPDGLGPTPLLGVFGAEEKN